MNRLCETNRTGLKCCMKQTDMLDPVCYGGEQSPHHCQHPRRLNNAWNKLNCLTLFNTVVSSPHIIVYIHNKMELYETNWIAWPYSVRWWAVPHHGLHPREKELYESTGIAWSRLIRWSAVPTSLSASTTIKLFETNWMWMLQIWRVWVYNSYTQCVTSCSYYDLYSY